MHVVVIGNGITGVTAARTLRKRRPSWRITVVGGETDLHYSRPALMYLFMGHMRFTDTIPYPAEFWKKNRIQLTRAWATRVDTERQVVELGGQDELPYDKLLIATGSTPNRFGWPGQHLRRVQGLYSIQDLLSLQSSLPEVRDAVLVGGGLIGVELAEMLLSRRVSVTFLVRETSYWDNVLPAEESAMVTRLVRHHRVNLLLNTELKEIHDDGDGAADGVTTSDGERLDAQFVGLTAGVRPNIELAEHSGLPTGRGVLVDRTLCTPIDNVYAAGDCAEIETGAERNLIQQVWYTGRAQGEAAARAMMGETTPYTPGIWFNSAKFFNLEYQVYGTVPPARRPIPGARSLYWEHPDGEHSVRLVVDAQQRLIGVNVMGIRFRHRVCEGWIRHQTPVDTVLGELGRANFDPELYQRHTDTAAAAMRAAR